MSTEQKTERIQGIKPVVERFILDEETVKELMSLTPEFGFNGLGKLVFYRTYSRGNENWGDVVKRVIEGTMSIRKEHYRRNSLEWIDEKWQSLAREISLSLFHMEWLPPGRGLWMMGTDFTYERGSTALNNCSATNTADDLVLSCEWSMDCLMNGVGVGFTTNWRGSATAPDKEDKEVFVIPDSREGWVQSLIQLMCAYIDSPKYGKTTFPIFDYSEIRPAGEPIKGFGGTASGPGPLKKMHERIESYLDAFCKGKLETHARVYQPDDNGILKETEVDIRRDYGPTRLVADCMNAIGACVVAGNVRRSAEIALGGVNDEEFIDLKDYTKNPERGEIGWMSNNSVVLEPEEGYKDFDYLPRLAARIRDNGEPGMINLYNMQKFGRYGKEMRDDASLCNPCGEIALENFELCNLSEVFPPRCKDEKRFYAALKYATFYASTVSLLPTHRVETNKVVGKNRRIGVSISGIAQWASGEVSPSWGKMNYTKMTKFLREGYHIVKETNISLAKEAGIPASIRVTTVKPSGSISLLAGVTPGVHYPVSRYAVRRVRIGKDSPLVPDLINANVPHEIDRNSDNTFVFEFAIDHGNVRPCERVSPWEQFALVATMQRSWADNMVSATIYFDKEKDGDDVEKMLAMHIPTLKSVSMLPHSGHGYAQAPYTPCSKEEYENRLAAYKIPDFTKVTDNVPVGSKYCTGDKCML